MADKLRDPVSKNPFFDSEEDDVDDFSFVSHPQQGSGGYVFHDEREKRREADQRAQKQRQMLEEMDRIQRRTVDSSARSLGLVLESEQIGVTTAESLLHQREQLERSEANVSNINRALRSSQKHINSIKSIFSNFGSMFSKTPEAGAATPPTALSDTEPGSKRGSSALSNTVEVSKSQPPLTAQEHPALKMRGIDYADNEDSSAGRAPPAEVSLSGRMTNYESQLDDNLDNLTLGLGRLKGLAMGLTDEIAEQNEMLDRLATGVDKADVGIERQNKQMRKILKK